MAYTVAEGIGPDLLHHLEENLWAFWRDYGRTPGAELYEGPYLRWSASGVPLAVFNGVHNAQLPEAAVDSAVSLVQSVANRRGVPAMWWVGPNSRPADLGARLEQHGLALARTMIGMAVDLEALDQGATVADLGIERVRGPEMQRLWAHVLAEGSGWGETAARALADLEPTRVDADCTAKPRYIGFLSGRAVATSALVPAAGLAGVYAIATLPEARARGIGAAMTAYPLIEARTQGYRVGVLQATAMGHSVYRRLGFRDVCQYRCYSQPPRADATLST
jgi:GNAT superfamily N-acetyltransferase